MASLTIAVNSYFDGWRYHSDGPYWIEITDGVIRRITSHPGGVAPPQSLAAPFVMPGLIEAHCHLFLDGSELDVNVRKAYLSAPAEAMLATARRSVAENLAAGVTTIRDAGDFFGINKRIKAECAAAKPPTPIIRSPGFAMRRAGRYGSFMALEVTDADSIVAAIHKLAPTADDLKILLTGIIDFDTGKMKGGVQFDLEETRLIVRTARQLGLRTYAHCSGLDGLEIAVKAGIDSIEHGFFMEREILRAMSDQGTAWVPTFSPVQFVKDNPTLINLSSSAVVQLDQILRQHHEQVAAASNMGVMLVAGSDAGSYGVPHGKGLVDELLFFHDTGMNMEEVLTAATSRPRRLWGCPSRDIAPGNSAELLVLEGSPFDDIENLRRPRQVVIGNDVVSLTPASIGRNS
ncbi:MAG: amidohydrolase family protein [Phycisphaeraceae bacterium]|nr:amidohydrolase family protein [Phycisphaeraceae bacterium]